MNTFKQDIAITIATHLRKDNYEEVVEYVIRTFRTLIQRSKNGTLEDHDKLQKYIDEALNDND